MTAVAAFLTVVKTGPLTTVQDAGRFGLAALGIGRSGACDRAAYRLICRGFCQGGRAKRRPDGFSGAASPGRIRLTSWRACRFATARSD